MFQPNSSAKYRWSAGPSLPAISKCTTGCPMPCSFPAQRFVTGCGAMTDAIEVADRGERLTFTFADLMRYHGPASPGGVAIAFKLLELVLPLLDPDGPCERREIAIATAFGGPGARDGFELVTRAVS